MNPRTLEIKLGMVITCDTLQWNEGWDFDFPSMMLNPVIKCFESGAGHYRIIESVMIEAVVEGKLKDWDFQQEWGWRGYKLPVLRRRFREALAGKHFPIANYHAVRSVVRIVKDEYGDLTWVDVV